MPILAAFVVSLAAFRRALPPARRRSAAADARRGVRRDVGAMDGRARGRLRPDQGPPAVRAHRQGRPRRTTRCDFHGVLGGGARRRCWCSARSCCSRPTATAVREITIFAVVLLVQSLPFLVGRRARGARGLAAQRIRLLARAARPRALRARCRRRQPPPMRRTASRRRPPRSSSRRSSNRECLRRTNVTRAGLSDRPLS